MSEPLEPKLPQIVPDVKDIEAGNKSKACLAEMIRFLKSPDVLQVEFLDSDEREEGPVGRETFISVDSQDGDMHMCVTATNEEDVTEYAQLYFQLRWWNEKTRRAGWLQYSPPADVGKAFVNEVFKGSVDSSSEALLRESGTWESLDKILHSSLGNDEDIEALISALKNGRPSKEDTEITLNYLGSKFKIKRLEGNLALLDVLKIEFGINSANGEVT